MGSVSSSSNRQKWVGGAEVTDAAVGSTETGSGRQDAVDHLDTDPDILSESFGSSCLQTAYLDG